MIKGKRSAMSRIEVFVFVFRLVVIHTEEAHELVYMRGEAKNHKGDDGNNAYTCRGSVRCLISIFRFTEFL